MALKKHKGIFARSLDHFRPPRKLSGIVYSIRYLKQSCLSGIGAAGILIGSAQMVHASALSLASFDQLATVCAPSVSTATLQAVASVESHFDPFVLRDNTTRETLAPPTASTATTIAEARLAKRHSLDLGLMQINSANLAALRLTISDAFDACHSLAAASEILKSARAAGITETDRQAATLITLSRYNTGRSLAGIANGYANRVMVAEGAVDTAQLQTQSEPLSSWDVWSADGAEATSWVITAYGSSEIERAGAQSSDARNEGRAPASPSEKGEPYVLFAYQESEPSKP